MTARLLCHSTNAGNLASIRAHGLQPRVGAAVQQSDFYTGPDEALPLVFLAEHAASLPWQVATHLGTTIEDLTSDDLREHGVLCLVEHAPGIHLKLNDIIYNHAGNEVDAVGGIAVGDLPPYIEDCDHFSLTALHPVRVVTGDDLLDLLRCDYADYIPAHLLDGDDAPRFGRR